MILTKMNGILICLQISKVTSCDKTVISWSSFFKGLLFPVDKTALHEAGL